MSNLKIEDKEYYYEFCYYVNNVLVGKCSVFLEDYCLCDVEIEESYQNQGYGTAMIKAVIKYMNNKPLWLFVYEFNLRAIRVYEKCGFTVNKFEYNSWFGRNMYIMRLEVL